VQQLERVLVTGANGHVGRRLIQELRRGAVPVRALVRSERAAAALRARPEAAEAEIAVAGYDDADALLGAARGCEHAVHLVGILKEAPGTRYGDAHEGATAALVRAAEKAGVRRIAYLSILGADPASPNPCLASKGRAEEILLSGPVPAVVLRVPMVLGPGDFASRSLRRKATARLLFLVRGGATLEQPIDAGDVVAALVAALSRPQIAGARLDLAGPESLPHRELVRRAAALHGTHPHVLPIPWPLARGAARLMQRVLSNPPLTLPMLEVLEHDDRVDARTAAARLGIELTPLDVTLRRTVGPQAEAA
jgi:NADH dehydrogenase